MQVFAALLVLLGLQSIGRSKALGRLPNTSLAESFTLSRAALEAQQRIRHAAFPRRGPWQRREGAAPPCAWLRKYAFICGPRYLKPSTQKPVPGMMWRGGGVACAIALVYWEHLPPIWYGTAGAASDGASGCTGALLSVTSETLARVFGTSPPTTKDGQTQLHRKAVRQIAGTDDQRAASPQRGASRAGRIGGSEPAGTCVLSGTGRAGGTRDQRTGPADRARCALAVTKQTLPALTWPPQRQPLWANRQQPGEAPR